MKRKGLTPKQQKFVDAYTGNGTAAARAAGYRGNDHTLAQVARENLRKPEIAAAIKARAAKEAKPIIATRTERQTFWSKVMNDRTELTRDRLRAAELLGKSEADFTEKLEVKGELTLEALVRGSMKPPEPT